MPIFISQGRYSRDAIKGMIAKPEDRAEAATATPHDIATPQATCPWSGE